MSFNFKESLLPNFNHSLLAPQPVPLWTFDAKNFEIIFSNRLASETYEYTAQEFVNTSFLDIFLEKDRISFLHQFSETSTQLKGLYDGY